MTLNKYGLDRRIEEDDRQIVIHQWNQVLVRAVRTAPNRIMLTKSTETLHPSDFITLANWAYKLNGKPNDKPIDQGTTEP